MLVRRDRGMVAVLIMLDVAFHAGRIATVSAADIAERAGLARRGIEPLLQALSRSGLLESVRGPRGGYRLGRPRREITLADIVATAHSDDVAAEPAAGASPTDAQSAGDLHAIVVEPLWGKLEAEMAAQLRARTLDDLVRDAERAGLRRPLAEPISFSI